MSRIILFDTSAIRRLNTIFSEKSELQQNYNQFAITGQTFAELFPETEQEKRKKKLENVYQDIETLQKEELKNEKADIYKIQILQKYKFKEIVDWLDIIKYEVARVKKFNIKYLENFPFKIYSYIEDFDIIKKVSMKEKVHLYNVIKKSLFDDIPKKEKSFEIDMTEIQLLENNINEEFFNAINIARKFIFWIPNLNNYEITEETPALYLLRRFYVFYKLLKEKGNKIINKNSKFNEEIIHIDESMFPDMLITIPCLPYVDEIISMDKSQSLLLEHLFLEYKFKISYITQT